MTQNRFHPVSAVLIVDSSWIHRILVSEDSVIGVETNNGQVYAWEVSPHVAGSLLVQYGAHWETENFSAGSWFNKNLRKPTLPEHVHSLNLPTDDHNGYVWCVVDFEDFVALAGVENVDE